LNTVTKYFPAAARCVPVLLGKIMVVAVLLLCTQRSWANDEPAYDEITIYVTMQGVGSVEIPAVIRDEVVYLAVANVFDFLKIRNTLSPGMDSLSGYFIHPQAVYLIDGVHNRISYQQKSIDLKKDGLMRTENNLYLRMDYFAKVFGLEFVFNFRSLSAVVHTAVELPVVREMRQEAMRNNISRLKGEEKADTSIGRRYAAFRMGMADWSVITTQNIRGSNDTRLNLGLGTVIAGGETDILLNYSSHIPFAERQQYYLWRLANNDNRALRQVMAGKIATQATSSIFFPVVGVQFTNTPTTYRRSFGTYRLSDRTEPGWMVELYVNSVLVNYVQADASGFFTFEVPLVYGNTAVKLRYYSPWGEERFSERVINIPFNFVPQKQLEYTVSAGMVEDSVNSRFARAQFNYGLGRRLTIGAGMEYLSSVKSGNKMPFVNASLRLSAGLLLYAEYTQNVRARGILSYRLPSDLQMELQYTRYKKGQTAINNTYLEERKAVVAYPFRGSKMAAFSRLSVYQVILPSVKQSTIKYTTAEALFSGVLLGMSTNLTTYALFTPAQDVYVYSNLSASFRLPSKLLFTPQVQYEYNTHKVIDVKSEVGRYFSTRGYLNLFYEENFKSSFRSFGIGLRFDFSFAQTGFSVRRNNRTTSMVQSASGSLRYDDRHHHLGVANRSSVGRGGITVVAFLDINNNGKRDKGEPRVPGLKVQVNSSAVQYNQADTSIWVSDLEAYASYLLRFTPSFDHINWQIRNKSYNVTVDPNQYKLLEIPVVVIGEIYGTVYLKEQNSRKGQGRMIVQLYRADGSAAGQTLTEVDGFFTFTGLQPGHYTARLDAAQLQKLNMTAAPVSIPVYITGDKDGDTSGDLEFTVSVAPKQQ
jgi:hypothetical protein